MIWRKHYVSYLDSFENIKRILNKVYNIKEIEIMAERMMEEHNYFIVPSEVYKFYKVFKHEINQIITEEIFWRDIKNPVDFMVYLFNKEDIREGNDINISPWNIAILQTRFVVQYIAINTMDEYVAYSIPWKELKFLNPEDLSELDWSNEEKISKLKLWKFSGIKLGFVFPEYRNNEGTPIEEQGPYVNLVNWNNFPPKESNNKGDE